MKIIPVLTLLLFVSDFIQCLKRTCVESASNKCFKCFKPLIAVTVIKEIDHMMIYTLQLYVSDFSVPNDFCDSKSTAQAKPGIQREGEL